MDSKIPGLKRSAPNYKKIYTDMIEKKYMSKREQCEIILKKSTLSTLDIIMLNNIISCSDDCRNFVANQKAQILRYTDDKGSIRIPEKK